MKSTSATSHPRPDALRVGIVGAGAYVSGEDGAEYDADGAIGAAGFTSGIV